MASLKIARGYVVDDGIAPDVAERGFAADSAASTSDHHAELGLVVQALGQPGVTRNVCERSYYAARGFRKDDRHFGYFCGTSVEAALIELLCVLLVVLADAEDIATRR